MEKIKQIIDDGDFNDMVIAFSFIFIITYADNKNEIQMPASHNLE